MDTQLHGWIQDNPSEKAKAPESENSDDKNARLVQLKLLSQVLTEFSATSPGAGSYVHGSLQALALVDNLQHDSQAQTLQRVMENTDEVDKGTMDIIEGFKNKALPSEDHELLARCEDIFRDKIIKLLQDESFGTNEWLENMSRFLKFLGFFDDVMKQIDTRPGFKTLNEIAKPMLKHRLATFKHAERGNHSDWLAVIRASKELSKVDLGPLQFSKA